MRHFPLLALVTALLLIAGTASSQTRPITANHALSTSHSQSLPQVVCPTLGCNGSKLVQTRTEKSAALSGSVYYVDNVVRDIHVASPTPDCTTYNPQTFRCGGGSATAYATIADVNKMKFKPGDQILFRRGEIWREQLTEVDSYNGSTGMPITFGSYGNQDSPLPIISGANLFTDWTPEQVLSSGSATTVYSAPFLTILGNGHHFTYVLYADTPKQVFQDGSRLTQNTSSYNSLTVGQWYLDEANSRIWVRLSGDDDPSRHTIEASQRDFGIQVYVGSYITISNLQVEDANVTGICFCQHNDDNDTVSRVVSKNNFGSGITFIYSSNDVVSHSTVANNGWDGIQFSMTPNMLIDQNIVHDNNQLFADPNSPRGGIKGGGYAATNPIVQNNLIYSNGKVDSDGTVTWGSRGIDFDTTGGGAIIRYNKIFSNTGGGIALDAESGDFVYGNVIFGNMSYGIFAFADGQPSLNGIQIYNNTINGNKSGGIVMQGPSSGSAPGGCFNNAVINNIVTNSINGTNLQALKGCENPGVNGYRNVYTFNAFGPATSNFIQWGIDPSSGRLLYKSTYDAWEAAPGNCGTTGCSHSVKSDPLFANLSTNDLTLSSWSSARGAGLNLGQMYENELNPTSSWPSNVLLNNQNSHRAGWDIGAYYAVSMDERSF